MHSEQNSAGQRPSSGVRPLIALVDDESSVLASIKGIFQNSPYDLRSFTTAKVALDYLQDHTPDLIISDLRMPGMTGQEFLRNAAVTCPTASRVILAGDEDREVVMDTMSQGIAEKYIMKPCEAGALNKIVEETLYVRSVLRQQHLHDLLRQISNLPTPPGAMDSLKLALRKKERSIKDLAAAVERNPGLVARLLRISNSVFFAARQPITDLVQAISFIGTAYVEGLILTMNTFRHVAGEDDARFKEALEQLWRRAVNRALIGREIAGKWEGYNDPQMAYVACLLMDIGYLVRIQLEPRKFLQLLQLGETTRRNIDELEGKVFDVNHAEVGEYLLRLWNFPSAITTAVRNHHDECVNDTLGQIVQIANLVEAADHSIPHDPKLNGLIDQWTRLNLARTEEVL
jgi:HD-like signal output (HDOD) protein/ActR/RegA family two-component response regulator